MSYKLEPLRLARLTRGLTQLDVAMSAGVSQPRLSYSERGYNFLKPYEKKRLAEFFEMDVDELFPKKDRDINEKSRKS